MRIAIRAVLAACAVALPAPALAWDYPGHRVVGKIADLVLAEHHPETAKKVAALLAVTGADGKSMQRMLGEVAVFPDCAKNDGYCGRPPSKEEVDYVARNKAHHYAFHYTDVPIEQRRYRAGAAGTNDTDVVAMIEYTVAQLRGKSPPKKDGVELTDTEALWLLAHLVGDIHQPLHVGAKYYDHLCRKSVDPNRDGTPPKFGIETTVAETQGGNKILLLGPAPAVPPAEQIHLYWDSNTVTLAMQAAGVGNSEQDFAKLLAAEAPGGVKPKGDASTWAAQWATEILPLAREAHTRLTIRVSKKTKPEEGARGCRWETTLDKSYQDWAKEQARLQVAKAGFRLAALLKEIFEP